MSWDFSKLPKSRHSEVIEKYYNNDLSGLLIIHDEYVLSPYNYCCDPTDREGILNWCGWAIHNQLIINESKT